MVNTSYSRHTIDLNDIWNQIQLKLLFRVLPMAILFSPQANAISDRLIQAAGLRPAPVVNAAPSATGEGSATHFAPSAHKPVPIQVGDVIGGYRVTSGYGPRPAPCPGCSSDHPAIDLATPTGTPVHAVGDIEVTCNYQDAAGQYAEFEYQGILHQVLHLSVCTPGSYTFGQVFAKTGATGKGTGPHADIRVKQDGQRVLPAREVIHAMFAPQDFKIAATDPAPATPGATAQPLSGDVMAQATQLIKEFEGFHPSPYWDYAQWTWGYGTRAPGRHGTISRERAEAELQAYLNNNCVPIIKPLNVSSSQAVALLSFCFNVGPEQFSTSTLVGLIRQGAPADQVAWEFGQWTKAGGKELQGLKNRRAREKQIFDENQ